MPYNYYKHLLPFPLVLSFCTSFAGGFQMHEQNAALGDVHASYSVNSNDASINFYNSAGLTDILSPKTTTSAVTVYNNVSFTGRTRVDTVPSSINPPITGNGTSNTTGLHVIPGAHYAKPINQKLAFGVSIASPFAAELNWPNDNFTKYNTTLNGIKTINFSPSFAYKLAKNFSLGLGVDIQYLEMNIDKMVGTSYDPTFSGQDPSSFDSVVTNRLTNTGLGWHAGLLFKPENYLKVGFNFRSGVRHKATGESKLKGRLAGQFTDFSDRKENISRNLKAVIKIPSSAALTVQLTPRTDLNLFSTLIYTKWDVIQNIQLENTPTAFVDPDTSAPLFLKLVSNQMKFRNTYTTLNGIHWQANSKLLLKAGYGYDQTPTNNTERDLKMPDGNRHLFGLGADYKYSQNLNIEIGYMFVKIENTNIHKKSTIPAADIEINIMNPGEVNEIYGQASGYANLVGVQTTFNADRIMRKLL